MLVGILQQFRRTAFARSGRGNAVVRFGFFCQPSFFVIDVIFLAERRLGILEDVKHVCYFLVRIQHTELSESPLL